MIPDSPTPAPITNQPASAPVPGLFDGQIQGGLPQPDAAEEVQVAGVISDLAGKGAKAIGDTVAPLFGSTMKDARQKVQTLEEGGTLPGITQPDMSTQPPAQPVVDTPVEAVDPALTPNDPAGDPAMVLDDIEPEGPLLPELSDQLRAEPIEPQPGGVTTPSKYQRKDAYERYITVTDGGVEAAIDAPAYRQQLLDGGMTDFNSGKVPDENSIQERMEVISQEYSGPIADDKRGVITHEETKQLADLIGMSPKKLVEAMLNRRRGEAIQMDGKGMVETMYAAKQLLVAEMRKLDELAEIAKSGTDEQALAFRYQFEFVANLQRNFKGSQTEIARAMSAMRIPATGVASDPGMADEMAARGQRDLSIMLEQYGGAADVRLMAEMLTKTGAPHQKGAFVSGIAKLTGKGKLVTDALYEVWQHSILTNPVSQIKNMIGNVGTILMSDLELAGAAAFGSARRAMGGEGGATFADLNAKVFGQVMSLHSAISYAGKAFMTMEPQLPGSKIDPQQSAGRKNVSAFSGEAFGATGGVATAIDWLGKAVTLNRIAFRSLEMGDTFFKTIANQGSMWEQAMSAGQARGLNGDDLSTFIADFVSDPPTYAVSRAEAEAKYISLQTDLDPTGKAFQKIQRLPLMRWIVPFLKTPYNATKWAFIDRTPLGLFWGDTRRKMDAGGKEADEAAARIALGTSVGLSAFMLTMGGAITGGGPANRQEAATDRRLGIQPYSIKIGDTYYSYAGTEPLASILGIWSDAAQIIVSGTQDDAKVGEIIAAAIAGTAHNLTNKSFMQNFATFLEAMNDPGRYSESMINGFIKSMVPRGVAHAKRMVDPVVRESRTYMEDLKAQIPGLSETLRPRVDLWGRDAKYGVPTPGGGVNMAWGPDVVSPIFVSQFKPTVVDLEMKRMRVKLSPQADTIQPEGLKEPLQLSDNERYWLQGRAGKLGFKNLEAFMKTPEYKQLQKLSVGGNKTVTELLVNKIRGIYMMAKRVAIAELEGGVSEIEKPGSAFDKMTNGAYNSKGEFVPGLLHRVNAIRTLEMEQTQQETGQIQ